MCHFTSFVMYSPDAKFEENRFENISLEYIFLEILAFWYYANEDSDDDVIGGSTKTVQHSIKNIYRNIGAVFFKLATRIVHHKRSVMTPMLLPWQYSAPVSFCEKPNIPISNRLRWDRE